MKTNTQYTLAVLIVAIIIIIPFAYGMFKALPPTEPVQIATSTPVTSTSTIATSTTTAPPQTSLPVKPAAYPYIQYITPTSGQVGSPVTIYGSGFLPTNTILFDGGPINNVIEARNGTALTFTVPSSVGADCQPNQACPMYARLIQNGTSTVSVRNTNGTSNTVTFTVTGGTTVVPN